MGICRSSVEKGIFRSSARVQICLRVFLLLSGERPLYILDTRPLSPIRLADIVFCRLSCHSLDGIISNANMSNFDDVSLFFLGFGCAV